MSTLKSVNVIHPSSAVNNIVNDASGNVAVGNNLTVAGTATIGGVAAVAVAPSTNGNVLTSNGTAWTSAAPSGGGLPTPSAIGQVPFSTDGSTYTATQKIVQGTAVASTSGTSIDFTSIPSWVKRITVMFTGVSTSGTSIKQIQLGTSSGVVSTGYLNGTSILAGTVASQNTTTGFGIYSISASDNLSGAIVISNITGNTWAQYGNLCITGGVNISIVSAGSLALSGVLDRVRITTVNGTDTFDAGSINILYE